MCGYMVFRLLAAISRQISALLSKEPDECNRVQPLASGMVSRLKWRSSGRSSGSEVLEAKPRTSGQETSGRSSKIRAASARIAAAQPAALRVEGAPPSNAD